MLPRLRHLGPQQKANAIAAAIVAHLAAHGFIEGWHTHFRSTPAPAATIAPQGHVAPTAAPPSMPPQSTIEAPLTNYRGAHGRAKSAHGARQIAAPKPALVAGSPLVSGFRPQTPSKTGRLSGFEIP